MSDSENESEKSSDEIAEVCPKCGSALVIRNSKNGPLLCCTSYPDCDFVRSASHRGVITVKIIDGAACPKCGGTLAVKQSRYGMFVGCTSYPECLFIHEERADDGWKSVACPRCGKGQMRRRATKYGKMFYVCSGKDCCGFVSNREPTTHSCPKCGFPVTYKHRGKAGFFLRCASIACKAKSPWPES